MKNIPYILGALMLLAMLHFSNLLDSFNLTHPIWRINAIAFGSIIGVVISMLIFWLSQKNQAIAGKIMMLIGVIFLVFLGTTLYYANAFITAADYDGFAIQVWHKGSYAVFATFVPLAAFLLRLTFRKF